MTGSPALSALCGHAAEAGINGVLDFDDLTTPPRGLAVVKVFSNVLANRALLSCLDQAVVSATSFITLIAMAWWTSPDQLGRFALGLSVLGVATALQHSLVSMPYSIQRLRPLGERRGHAFSCLLNGLMFAAATALAVLACAGLAAAAGAAGPAALALTIAAVLPPVLAREFARDFALAQLAPRRALCVDLCVSGLQLGVLAALGLTGRLSPESAFMATGLASAAVSAGAFLLWRGEFHWRHRMFLETTRDNWRLGKWLSVSRAAILIQGYSTHWLSALIAGPAATGVYAACMSVIALANPVVLGLYSFLEPRTVLVWKQAGTAALYRQALRDLLLICTLMSAFLVLVLLAGDELMALLYPGALYAGQNGTIVVLAISALVAAAAIPATNSLAAMERARPIATVSAVSVLVNLVLVWALLTQWGLFGAALGVLVANLAGTLGRWTVLKHNLGSGAAS